MAIVKLLLFLISTLGRHYGSTPPNARPPAEQLRQQQGIERALPLLTVLGRAVFWSWTLFEGTLLFALSGYCPPALAQSFLPTGSNHAALTTPTPAFLAGTALTLASALLRTHCYHTLGAHFTFELSIRPTHALVTHGVYSVVRHPSYTALVGMVVGSLLCVLDRDGCVMSVLAGTDGDGDGIVTGTLVCIWTTVLGVFFLGLHTRMNREDAMLEKQFGEAWRTWAEKVPWRIIPGVY